MLSKQLSSTHRELEHLLEEEKSNSANLVSANTQLTSTLLEKSHIIIYLEKQVKQLQLEKSQIAILMANTEKELVEEKRELSVATLSVQE